MKTRLILLRVEASVLWNGNGNTFKNESLACLNASQIASKISNCKQNSSLVLAILVQDCSICLARSSGVLRAPACSSQWSAPACRTQNSGSTSIFPFPKYIVYHCSILSPVCKIKVRASNFSGRSSELTASGYAYSSHAADIETDDVHCLDKSCLLQFLLPSVLARCQRLGMTLASKQPLLHSQYSLLPTFYPLNGQRSLVRTF